MNPFRKNKNKIDSKNPTDGIVSKEPYDSDEITSKTPHKEEYFGPPKVNIEPPKVTVKDFNPPPKKSKYPTDNSVNNLPSSYGLANEDIGYDNSRPLPKVLKNNKDHNDFIPSSIGKSDSKSKGEGRSLPKEALEQKEKKNKKPVASGIKDKSRKEQGKNNPLPKQNIKIKEEKNKKMPSTAGAFKEKEGGSKKVPKHENSFKFKDKRPPSTVNIQSKIPKVKKPKDDIPKQRIFSKNPK